MRKISYTQLLVLSLGFAACSPHVSVGHTGHGNAGGTDDGSAGAPDVPTPSAGSGSGSGSAGSAGKTNSEVPAVTGCANDLKQVLPDIVADCPDPPPSSGAPCDVPTNAICTWQVGTTSQDSGYSTMACRQSDGAKVWVGVTVSDGTNGINKQHCPHQPVTPGADCATHEGELCQYSSEHCLCDADQQRWTCEPGYDKALSAIQQAVKPLCVDFDEAKLVKDLTPEEARAWCTWAADPVSKSPPLALRAPANPPYTAQSTVYGGALHDVCLPILPIDGCVANLSVATACDATVREIDHCIETIRGQALVGDACESLLENPNCLDIVAARNGNGAPCELAFP